MSDSDDIAKNVLYVLRQHPLAAKKQSSLASQIGVNPSTLSRWEMGHAVPSSRNVRRIAVEFKIEVSAFDLPHDIFIGKIQLTEQSMVPKFKEVEQRIELGAISKWKHLWPECFERHKGSYLLYNHLMIDPEGIGKEKRIAVSLLNITEKTTRGIRFEIHNIDDRYTDASPNAHHYVYRGLMFPIHDCLSFYADEQSGDEPLAMVTSQSQTAHPSLLCGYLLAIGVVPSLRVPKSAKVALAFQGRRLLNPSTIATKLGIFSESKVPATIRGHL